ncbi:hypothetical protein FGIG_07935, partial [Fasciola gigantica]
FSFCFSGEQLEPNLRYPQTWLTLRPARSGYSLLGVAGHGPAPAGNWQLRLIGHGIHGDQGLPKLMGAVNKKTLCSTFRILDMSDYYVPNPQGLLFSHQIHTEVEQLITVQLRLSAPNVPVELYIRRGHSPIPLSVVRGTGDALLLNCLITPEQVPSTTESNDDQKSGVDEANTGDSNMVIKTSPKPSTQGRSTQIKKQVRSSVSESDELSSRGPLVEKQSARSTTSSHSSRSRSGDQEAGSQCATHSHKRARSQSPVGAGSSAESSVKLSDNSGSTERSAKPNSNSKPNSNRAKQPIGRVSSAKLDVNHAHWKLQVVTDAYNELSLVKNEDIAVQIRAIKRAWEEMEPGRAERAGLSRIRYLEQQVSKSDSHSHVTTVENLAIDRSRPSTRSSPVRGASSKSTPELSTSSLNERNIATPLDPDPATVYTLEPPTGLLRLPVSCPNGDRSSLIRSLVDAEQQRVQFAQDALENTVGQKLDPWFIGLRYLQLIEQCTEQSGDFLAVMRPDSKRFSTLHT